MDALSCLVVEDSWRWSFSPFLHYFRSLIPSFFSFIPSDYSFSFSLVRAFTWDAMYNHLAGLPVSRPPAFPPPFFLCFFASPFSRPSSRKRSPSGSKRPRNTLAHSQSRTLFLPSLVYVARLPRVEPTLTDGTFIRVGWRSPTLAVSGEFRRFFFQKAISGVDCRTSFRSPEGV